MATHHRTAARRLAAAAAGIAASVLLGAAAAPEPRQELYRETSDGWFIYVEDRSCVAYVDFDGDTMLRFSDRTDEHRMYFTAVSGGWQHLRPRLGAGVMLGLEFPEIGGAIQASGGMIIENPDGRLGYTGASFGGEQIRRLVGSGTRMVLHIWGENEPAAVVGSFSLAGGAAAAETLAECGERHFER
jgi:hypothetical protein